MTNREKRIKTQNQAKNDSKSPQIPKLPQLPELPKLPIDDEKNITSEKKMFFDMLRQTTTPVPIAENND